MKKEGSMKKFYSIVVLILILLFIGGCADRLQKPSESSKTSGAAEESATGETSKMTYRDFSQGELKVSEIFPKEKIAELLGKQIVKVEDKKVTDPSFVEYQCAYYLQPEKNVMIRIVRGDTETIRKGYEIVGWVLKKDSAIPLEHNLVYTKNNELRGLELILEKNLDVSVDFWGSGLTDEERMKFSKDFASYFKENFY